MAAKPDRLSGRQLGALACVAAELPVVRLCCRRSWVWVLPGSCAAALTLNLLTRLAQRRRRRPGAREPDRRRSPAAGLLLLLAAAAAWESAKAFPETAASPLAALLILLLAWAAARKGSAAVGRCAAVLLWITGALFGAVLLFSLPQLRLERLRPAGTPLDALEVWAALLIPGAALLLPDLGQDQRLPRWPWWTAAAGALAASLVTGGILSPALARESEAFRTLARGVSVLGVIRRFEALGNAAMLMSGFCLCALLLTAAELPKPAQNRGKTA